MRLLNKVGGYILSLAGLVLASGAFGATVTGADIRSPEGKPFIAHINLKLTDEEWENPGEVKVELASTEPSDFINQLRTRLFLESASKQAFLRISGLIPAPGTVTLNLTATHLDGFEKSQFKVTKQNVVMAVIEPYKPPPPPKVENTLSEEELALEAQRKTKKNQLSDDDVIAEDQIELRLVDQTKNVQVAPRSYETDLALLAKADQALNTDPALREQAAGALDILGGVFGQLNTLWNTKVTEEVAIAALKAESERLKDDFTLTIRLGDQDDEEQTATQAATESSNEMEDKPPATDSQALSNDTPSATDEATNLAAAPAQPNRLMDEAGFMPAEEESPDWPYYVAGLVLVSLAGLFALWRRRKAAEAEASAFQQLPAYEAYQPSAQEAAAQSYENERTSTYAEEDYSDSAYQDEQYDSETYDTDGFDAEGYGNEALDDAAEEITEPPAPPPEAETPTETPAETPTENEAEPATEEPVRANSVFHEVDQKEEEEPTATPRSLSDRLAALEAFKAEPRPAKSEPETPTEAEAELEDTAADEPVEPEEKTAQTSQAEPEVESEPEPEPEPEEESDPEPEPEPEEESDPEPEFSDENTSRLELAEAYLEINDMEAAEFVLKSLEGELTPAQSEKLAGIREKL